MYKLSVREFKIAVLRKLYKLQENIEEQVSLIREN